MSQASGRVLLVIWTHIVCAFHGRAWIVKGLSDPHPKWPTSREPFAGRWELFADNILNALAGNVFAAPSGKRAIRLLRFLPTVKLSGANLVIVIREVQHHDHMPKMR